MDASVAVSEQMRNLGVICAWGRENNKSSVLVFRDAFIGEPGFEFLSKHMPECSGVSVKATDYLSQADIVVHHPKDSRTSAALVSEPVKKQ